MFPSVMVNLLQWCETHTVYKFTGSKLVTTVDSVNWSLCQFFLVPISNLATSLISRNPVPPSPRKTPINCPRVEKHASAYTLFYWSDSVR